MQCSPRCSPREALSKVLLRKFAGYVLTGGAAAVVDIGGFSLLIQAGVDTPLAAAISFVIAAVCNFQLSTRFVFHHKPSHAGFVRFLLAALIGLAINVGVTVGTQHLFGLPAVLAKVCGVGVAFCANFLLNLLVVFRSPTPR